MSRAVIPYSGVVGRVCDEADCGNHVEMTVVLPCEQCGYDYCETCMREHRCERVNQHDRYGASCMKDSDRTNPRGC